MSVQFVHGYAVIAGIGADLPVTVPSATAVADLLRDPARCAYPPDQVRLLTAERARRQPILDALDWLAERTRTDPQATAIVTFSGHGIQTPAGPYLLPFGYDRADVDGTCISGAAFTARLQAVQARKLLVLLDCCYAGGIGEARAMGDPSPLPLSPAEVLSQGSGRVLIASSRKDEASWTANPYTAFGGALLEALAGYGAFERDGYARILDTAMWVGRKVPERTKDRQHPILKVSNLEDNFAIAYYAAGAMEPRRLDWAASVPAITPGLDAAQVASWQRRLAIYRENLLLIEERMSEYVIYTDIPLQLIKSKRRTEAQIAELERKLGLSSDP
jgi:hypothetical protein